MGLLAASSRHALFNTITIYLYAVPPHGGSGIHS